MLIRDPRPISLLTGGTALEAISKLSTNRIILDSENNTDRIVVCDPNGRVVDAPYVVWDENGVILLHCTTEIPEYLSSVARTLSKNSSHVMNATGAIERFVCHEEYLPRNTGMSVNGLGVSGLYSIALNPLEYENIHVVDLSSDQLIEFGGLTDSHLNGNYLPHHIGLLEYVRLDNGCYPGQEIHARMDSRNPSSKKLIRINLDGVRDIKSLTIQGHNCRLIPEWSDSYAHGITHQDLLDGEYETEFGIVHTTTVNTAL